LLTYYEQVIQSLALLPSVGGRFEVRVDGETIFSKQALKRHAEPGEIIRLLGERAARQEQAIREGISLPGDGEVSMQQGG
jgi:selenoprotein W-related protein